MLISNEKSRIIDQERPVNTNSSSASLFDKSNKTIPSSQTSLSYPVNNVSQNFLSNEHLTRQHCNKTYKTETRLNRHKTKCKKRDKTSDDNKHNIPSTSNDNDAAASRTIEYPWSQTGNTISSNTIDKIYNEIVFWRKNIFLLTSGSCRKRDIEETTRLLDEWIHGFPLNGISFKAVMLMPNLLLQKRSKNSKSKDYQLTLERRLELWHKGEFEELYVEGETIQASLTTIQNASSIAEISKKSKQFMAKGNISSALKLLTNNMENGILPLNKDTLSKLLKGKTASQDILLNGPL